MDILLLLLILYQFSSSSWQHFRTVYVFEISQCAQSKKEVEFWSVSQSLECRLCATVPPPLACLLSMSSVASLLILCLYRIGRKWCLFTFCLPSCCLRGFVGLWSKRREVPASWLTFETDCVIVIGSHRTKLDARGAAISDCTAFPVKRTVVCHVITARSHASNTITIFCLYESTLAICQHAPV